MAQFIQHHKLYKLIPMKSSTVLPDEGFPKRFIDIFDRRYSNQQFVTGDFQVYCLPKNYHKNSYAKHRVMVICDCGKHVPFGRMGQHYHSKPCLEKLNGEKVS